MIYFDNAATSWPKPTGVAEAMIHFMEEVGANPGRAAHITVDAINGAFVHRDEMGVSLLRGATDRSTFEEAVAHELHHVCFRFWAERDGTRQKLKQERSGRAVAVRHIENLLSEGMANCYCSPRYVFETRPDRLYLAPLSRPRNGQNKRNF